MSVVSVPSPEVLSRESLYLAPLVVPPFVKRMGAMAAESGLANAVVDTLSEANIAIEIDGDLSPAADHGLIIAGDHRQRIEPLLVQALMGKAGREASYVLAMPTSFAGRLLQSSGNQGQERILPVIPSGVSAENKPSLRRPRSVLRRLRHPEIPSRPKDEVKAMNARALTRGSMYAAAGGAVTIFPSGSDANLPWYRGLGQMVHELPSEAHETTQVAVLRPDNFSVRKVMSALALRDVGICFQKQTIVLRTRLLGTVEDVCGPYLDVDTPGVAQKLSDVVRDRYSAQFTSRESKPMPRQRRA